MDKDIVMTGMENICLDSGFGTSLIWLLGCNLVTKGFLVLLSRIETFAGIRPDSYFVILFGWRLFKAS